MHVLQVVVVVVVPAVCPPGVVAGVQEVCGGACWAALRVGVSASAPVVVLVVLVATVSI